MSSLHGRTSPSPLPRHRRQRRLTAAAVLAGLLVGISLGAATADLHSGEAPSSPLAAAAPAVAPAAAPAAPESLWPLPETDPGALPLLPLIAKVTLALGLVVLLAWGTVYLLRRSALGQGGPGPGSTVRVVDRSWLGPKKAIYLVDIAGRTLALGVTEETISVLSSWEEGQIELPSSATQGPGAFAAQLRALLGRARAGRTREALP